jgi:hypothetical protein
LVSVEIEQDEALTPVGAPLTVPLLRTVIEPPVLEIGPETVVETVLFAPLQEALAAPGRPSAASTISEAEASSAERVFLNVGGKNHEDEVAESSRPPSRAA